MVSTETSTSVQAPIQTLPTPISTKSPNSKLNSKNILFFLVLFILIFSLSANFLQFQGFFVNKYLGFDVYRLPISPNSDYIKNVGINYYLETRIVEIKKTSDQIELITAIRDDNLPKFLISDKTNVFIRKGSQLERSAIEKLQIGQKVGVILQFTLISQPTISRILIDP